MNDFLKGLSYLLTGFRFLMAPSLKRFVIVPFLINLILFTILWIVAIHWFGVFSQWVEHFLPTWLQWLHWLIWILSILISGIFLIYLSTFIVNIAAGPFNSILSTKVEQQLLSHYTSDKKSTLITEIPAAIKRQFQVIFYYVPRAFFYLILFLVPIVQVIAAVLWFIFNSWIMSLQYIDYPMDNHGISFHKMRELMQKRPLLNLGFGIGVLLFTLIPFINFLIVPAAVAGATALWVKEYRNQHD
jgi:CysZ protein